MLNNKNEISTYKDGATLGVVFGSGSVKGCLGCDKGERGITNPLLVSMFPSPLLSFMEGSPLSP